MHDEARMRSLLLGVIFVVGCSTNALPGGGATTVVGDPDLGPVGSGGGGGGGGGEGTCVPGQPDGAALPVGDLATAQTLLTGRWRLCSTSSNTIGSWTPASFGGIEFTSDGQFFVLDTTLARGDVQGLVMYNPLPGPDWEQIALRVRGQGDDYMVSFSDGPRRLRLTGPNSFSASFVQTN
jgi:hypothetical protein